MKIYKKLSTDDIRPMIASRVATVDALSFDTDELPMATDPKSWKRHQKMKLAKAVEAFDAEDIADFLQMGDGVTVLNPQPLTPKCGPSLHRGRPDLGLHRGVRRSGPKGVGDAVAPRLRGHFTMTSLGTFYALYHPDLGYVTFGSYATVQTSPHPNPRGLFGDEGMARARIHGSFWAKRLEYKGADLQLRHINLSYDPLSVGSAARGS